MDRSTRLALAAFAALALALAAHTPLAHAQELGAPMHAAAQVAGPYVPYGYGAPPAPQLTSPRAVALSTQLFELQRERASIDFTGAHWLMGLGGFLLPTAGVTALLGLVAHAVGSAYHTLAADGGSEQNPLLVISGVGALGGLAMIIAGACWAGGLGARQGALDGRIRSLTAGLQLELMPMQNGAMGSVTVPF